MHSTSWLAHGHHCAKPSRPLSGGGSDACVEECLVVLRVVERAAAAGAGRAGFVDLKVRGVYGVLMDRACARITSEKHPVKIC